MLIGDGYAIKGNIEEVKGDKKALKLDGAELKGDGEVLKSDEKVPQSRYLAMVWWRHTKTPLGCVKGQGGVVVSTAAFHARVWVSVPGLGGLKKKK